MASNQRRPSNPGSRLGQGPNRGPNPPPPPPPPPQPPAVPTRSTSLLSNLFGGGKSKEKKKFEPPQPTIFESSSHFGRRVVPAGRVPVEEHIPDPIRRDPAAEARRALEGPSLFPRQLILDSPPKPPRKDTPPEKKKRKTSNVRESKSSPAKKPSRTAPNNTNSSPIKPSTSATKKRVPKSLKVLNDYCDQSHLYCRCPKSASLIPTGLQTKLFFGNDNDPDDPIRALELSGDLPTGILDLQNPSGLGIFGVEKQPPTSVLHGNGDLLLTRADKAEKVLSDPRLRNLVLAREHQLLVESEKRKRAEYERQCALEQEGRRQLIERAFEARRQEIAAEKERLERQEREKREAKEAEEKRRQQIQEEYPALKAELEELRRLKEEHEKQQRLKGDSAQVQTLRQEVIFLRDFKERVEEVEPDIVRMVFEGGTAYPESDADDEYERSPHDTSPILATGDDETESEGSGGQTSNEHTPTTYGRMGRDRDGDNFPEGLMTDWDVDDCADFLASLGYGQYADSFIENEITGEALIALLHDDLKECGIISVGHRLSILKAVYELKLKQDIPIESDHYVPHTETDNHNAPATVRDIKVLLEQIRARDDRLSSAEQLINKVLDENRRLREDLLPVFKMAKEQQPLPYHPPAPQQNYAQQYANAYSDPNSTVVPPAPKSSGLGSGGLQRKFSTKQFFLGSTPKNASPTHMQHQQQMEHALDPSAAAERAVLSSSHLAAMNGGQSQTSPGLSSNVPSPSSPPHAMKNTISGSTLASRSYSRGQDMSSATPRQNYASDADTIRDSNQSSYQPSTYPRDSVLKPPQSSRRAPTPAPGSSSGQDQIEVFKSFKVSMDDPCWKVLPAALKKYKIDAPTEQYALYIVYGDKERCLEAEEKPLILFKELDRQGRKPMFMLRKTTAHPDSAASGAGVVDPRLPRGGGQLYEPPGGII